MDAIVILVAGLATFFNFAILKYKFTKGRTADAILDVLVLGVIVWFTKGSMTGMIVGMIGSMLFSIYLLWSPFNLEMFEEDEPTIIKRGV